MSHDRDSCEHPDHGAGCVCGFKPRRNRAFSSSVYLLYGEMVLLVLHKSYSLWLPIGGELEANETPLEAAIRETREETGIVLKDEDFRYGTGIHDLPGFFRYDEHDAGAKGLHMNFSFVARSPTDQVALCDEHFAACWYQLKAAEHLTTTENVRQCLRLINRMSPARI